MCSIGIRLLASLCCLFVTAAHCHTASSDQHEALSKQLDEGLKSRQVIYIQSGLLYLHDKEFDHALADFKKAEQLGPAINVAHVMGLYYFRQQQVKEALVYFDRYLAYFPKHLSSLQYRAKSLKEQGEFVEAIKAYHIYIDTRAKPSVEDYLYLSRLFAANYGAANLSDTRIQAELESSLGSRLKILDEGMASLGVNPLLQKEAIQLLLESGFFVRALERHNSLVTILGVTPRWLSEKGDLLMLLARDKEATVEYRRACEQLQVRKVTPATQKQLQELSHYCQLDK